MSELIKVCEFSPNDKWSLLYRGTRDGFDSSDFHSKSDPIQLPCGDLICRQHLLERDVVKENRIKCKKCNEEYGVKDNQFKSNNQLKK
jgi:hypothetical protein